MTSHTIDQAVVTGGHRPMSLLLQALKQIELKAPSETASISATVVERSTAETEGRPETDVTPDAAAGVPAAAESAPMIGSSALVAPSSFHTETTAPSCEISIEIVRHYREGETDSAVALAEPCELRFIPPASQPDMPANVGVGPRHASCRLGEEVLRLLPDDSRAVIAIVSFSTADAEPVAHEICTGLAVTRPGGVLSIAEDANRPFAKSSAAGRPSRPYGANDGLEGRPPDFLTRPNRAPRTGCDAITFVDVASGSAHWQDAVVRHPHFPFSSLPRGDLRALKLRSRRHLLTVWQELGEQFDYVVLEVATAELDPMLPILATCDAALLALRLNETKRADVEQLDARIRSSGCHVCGCLVR